MELIHPRGTCRRIGSLTNPGPSENCDWLDLAVPRPGLGGGRRWLRGALEFAGASLGRDGIAWLTPPRGVRPWVGAEAVRAGVRVKEVYAQFADARGAKAIAPLHLLRESAVAGLAGRRVRMRELAAWAFRLPGVTQAFQSLSSSIAFAIGRPGSLPPCNWLLAGAGVPALHGSVLLRRSWHEPYSVIAHLFDDREGVVAVAKIPGRSGIDRIAQEARLLREVAARARGWGVETPELLDFPHAPKPVLATRAIQGRPASAALQRSSSDFLPLMAKVADWLSGWNRSTLAQTPPAAIGHELAEAASVLESLLPNGREYFARLHELAAESGALPSVASHGDLTMWNVIISRTGLGILDWEEARERDTPLGDLFYSMVDAAAAVEGYRDRAAAFDRCFFGSLVPATAPFVERLAKELKLGRPAVEICFHLAWLRHAVDEVRRNPANAGAFFEISRRISLMRSLPISYGELD